MLLGTGQNYSSIWHLNCSKHLNPLIFLFSMTCKANRTFFVEVEIATVLLVLKLKHIACDQVHLFFIDFLMIRCVLGDVGRNHRERGARKSLSDELISDLRL